MHKLPFFPALIFSISFAFAQNNKIVLDGGVEIFSYDDMPREMDAVLFSGKLTEAQKLAYMPGGKAPASVNVFLIKMGGKTYMVDAGFGNAIKDKRIDPKKIDAVFLTHAHGDHISGLMQGDSAIFSAPVFISKQENDYWMNKGTPNSDLQKKTANAYAKQYKTFAFGDTIIPGIVAINAVGHTPGHTAFLVGIGKQKILIAGDFLHAAILQFPEPTESASYDVDKEQAVKTRKFLMEQAEKNSWIIAGIHVPNPGWGKVKSNGKGGFIFNNAN